MEITISNSQEETLRSDKKGRKTRKQRFFIALITIPLKNLLKKNGKQAKKRLQYSKTETFTHTSHKISGYSALSRRIRSAPTRSTPQYIPQNYVLSFIFFIIFSTIHFVSHQLPPQRTFTKSRLLYVH